MKAHIVKCYARLGQIAYWSYCFLSACFEVQLPNHVPTEFSGTIPEVIFLIGSLVSAIIFSEVIVKLIGYFAELLEEKK